MRVKTKDGDKVAAIKLQESFVEKSGVWLHLDKLDYVALPFAYIETLKD